LHKSHVLLLCDGFFTWNKYPVVKKTARLPQSMPNKNNTLPLGFAFIQLIASKPDVFAFSTPSARHRLQILRRRRVARRMSNPNDPKDKYTPDPPQPKDEFVLKFMKP
jgi:hypothetical protein